MVQFNFKFQFPMAGTGEVLEAEMPLERPEDLAGLSVSIPDYTARAQLVEFVRQLMQQASDAGVITGRQEGYQAANPELQELQDRAVKAETSLAELHRKHDNLGNNYQAACSAHEADIKRIGEAMMRAAEDHDWCEVFDDYVDELNKKLAFKLPTRTHEYIVRRTYLVTTEEKVTCRDEDEALIDSDELGFGDFCHGPGTYLPIIKVEEHETWVSDPDLERSVRALHD